MRAAHTAHSSGDSLSREYSYNFLPRRGSVLLSPGTTLRADLLASIGVTAGALSDMLFDLLTNKLVNLRDQTLVYPAHGAGSMCGKNLSKDTVSTIGEQKKFNYALQPMNRAEFKKIVTAEQPEAPGYFVHDAILNRQ